jgi:hypothetical protein
MTRPRITNLLDIACAAYIAGLVDGQGTITLSRIHRNERRRLAILRFVLAAIAAGKVTSKRTYHPLHAVNYTYQILSRQALELLRQIKPFLRSCKVRRAQLILDNYLAVTPRTGEYSAGAAAARDAFEAEVLAIRL